MACSQSIEALKERLNGLRGAKPRFAFKLKKTDSAMSPGDAAAELGRQRVRIPGSTDSSEATAPSLPASPPSETAAPPQPGPAREPGALGASLQKAGVQSKPEPSPPDNYRTAIHETSLSQSNTINISSYRNLHIVLPLSAARAAQGGFLTNLRRCIVDMGAPAEEGQPLAALVLKDIRQSLLICGSVAGSTHITRVSRSVIVVATRQFRMHECTDCIVYLHVNSKPIIEDCDRIQSAPLPQHYVRLRWLLRI
jgi:tubulin-specific chaperone C